MRAASVAALVAAVVLAACAPARPSAEPTSSLPPSPSASPAVSSPSGTGSADDERRTWIAVYGPPDSSAPGDLVLEIGESAWYGYGGVVSVVADHELQVRLVERGTCQTYATFRAPPGTMWAIRFAVDGSVSVEDWTGRDMDAGPALSERPSSGCP